VHVLSIVYLILFCFILSRALKVDQILGIIEDNQKVNATNLTEQHPVDEFDSPVTIRMEPQKEVLLICPFVEPIVASITKHSHNTRHQKASATISETSIVQPQTEASPIQPLAEEPIIPPCMTKHQGDCAPISEIGIIQKEASPIQPLAEEPIRPPSMTKHQGDCAPISEIGIIQKEASPIKPLAHPITPPSMTRHQGDCATISESDIIQKEPSPIKPLAHPITPPSMTRHQGDCATISDIGIIQQEQINPIQPLESFAYTASLDTKTEDKDEGITFMASLAKHFSSAGRRFAARFVSPLVTMKKEPSAASSEAPSWQYDINTTDPYTGVVTLQRLPFEALLSSRKRNLEGEGRQMVDGEGGSAFSCVQSKKRRTVA